MDQIINQILDRTMSRSKEGPVKGIIDDLIDKTVDKASPSGKKRPKGRKKDTKKKKLDTTKDRTCCDLTVCSPPDSPSKGRKDVPPPAWVLEEHTHATIAASELRRVILRLRQCKHWASLHSACDCRRQRWNQWRAWDLHTHFCPKIGMPQYLEEEVRDDLKHLDELFSEHHKEMNEMVWPAALDMQCKRGRPSSFITGPARAFYSSSSSSEFSVSVTSFDYEPYGSGSGESVVRGIIFDILMGLREAPSSDSGDHWGDTGDYDERRFYPWQNDPEPPKEPEEDQESADVVEVQGFIPKPVMGGEYYEPGPESVPELTVSPPLGGATHAVEFFGPGPDGTRARPDLPLPAAPFDASRGDDPLELEF